MTTYNDSIRLAEYIIAQVRAANPAPMKEQGCLPLQGLPAEMKALIKDNNETLQRFIGTSNPIVYPYVRYVPLTTKQRASAIVHANAAIREIAATHQAGDGALTDRLKQRMACDRDSSVQKAILKRAESDSAYADVYKMIQKNREITQRFQAACANDDDLNARKVRLQAISNAVWTPRQSRDAINVIKSSQDPYLQMAFLTCSQDILRADMLQYFVQHAAYPQIAYAAFLRGAIQDHHTYKQVVSAAALSPHPVIRALGSTYPNRYVQATSQEQIEFQAAIEKIVKDEPISEFLGFYLAGNKNVAIRDALFTSHKGVMAASVYEAAIQRNDPYTAILAFHMGIHRTQFPQIIQQAAINCQHEIVRQEATNYPLAMNDQDREIYMPCVSDTPGI